MRVYIVTKNEEPCFTTFDEEEACAVFDDVVRSGHYRQAAVLFVPANEDHSRVLLEAHQGW